MRSGTALDGAGIAVPDNPGAQLGEFVGGVAPGQQVQGGLEGGTGERSEGGGAADSGEPFLHVDRAERGRGHGLLGQDVQRVGRHVQAFDFAVQHAFDSDGCMDQIRAVLGEEHALGDLADLVAGAAHPLQSAGHGGR